MPTPAATSRDVQVLDNFIGGRWVKAQTSEFFDVHNPAVGDVIGRTPLSTAVDVDTAVRAATNSRAIAHGNCNRPPMCSGSHAPFRRKGMAAGMSSNSGPPRRAGT